MRRKPPSRAAALPRDALADMILGRNVRVEVANTDQYGRAVGKVYVDGKFVNFEMVKLGHAWHYVAYARDEPEFALAELAAAAPGSASGMRRIRLPPGNTAKPTNKAGRGWEKPFSVL